MLLEPHPSATKLALLCALLYLREREVTDALAQLLISTVHRINARSEEKVITELVKDFKRVTGKETLLRKIAEASLGTPDARRKAASAPSRSPRFLSSSPRASAPAALVTANENLEVLAGASRLRARDRVAGLLGEVQRAVG